MAERRTLETILLENKLVSAEQLEQVTRYASAVGIDLFEAVLQKKIASPDDIMMAYAESIGLPFIHLAGLSIDEELIAPIDPITARQYSFVPVSMDKGYVLLATTKPVLPDVEEELRMIFDLPVRCAICTPTELSEAITKYFPRGAAQTTKADRKKRSPAQQKTQKPVIQKSQPVEPMNDEEKKNRLLMSFVAFNFSVAFVCFASYNLRIPRGILGTWAQFPHLALLGLVVGGIVAFVVCRKFSR